MSENQVIQKLAYIIMQQQNVTFREALRIAKGLAYDYTELRKRERRNK